MQSGHFVQISSMAEQQQQEEDTSSESDNEENLDATDPILVATNAGAHLSVPKSASISCKQKLHINEGKYKGKARSTCATKRTYAWDRLKEYQIFLPQTNGHCVFFTHN